MMMKMREQQKEFQITVNVWKHFSCNSQYFLSTVRQQKLTGSFSSNPAVTITGRGTHRLSYKKWQCPSKHGRKFGTALPHPFIHCEMPTGHLLPSYHCLTPNMGTH